ncbi:hypothetical protein niasHS_001155 [Heterodera schachtii]|uniref:Uncharacterized protein n=1 Tax=Heterodera schachtii TaxID=97005 RepID=A0ABD2KCE3_HETSC
MGECQKDFFATVHRLQEMAPAFFAGTETPTENGKFLEKAFDTLCCITIKAENNAMKKDELAEMIGEFEANQRNFCQQLKNGQNIWEAVESSAGNAIVTAAKDLKVNPQTYEEGIRKLTKLQIVSPENQPAIGTFVKHCIASLKIFQEFITDERLPPTLFASGQNVSSDQTSALSDQQNGMPSRRTKRARSRDLRECLLSLVVFAYCTTVSTLLGIILHRGHVAVFSMFSFGNSDQSQPNQHLPALAVTTIIVTAISILFAFVGFVGVINHCFGRRH